MDSGTGPLENVPWRKPRVGEMKVMKRNMLLQQRRVSQGDFTKRDNFLKIKVNKFHKK
jgi:hypothetical protein